MQRRVFATERFDYKALKPSMRSAVLNILFVSVENAMRSQLAESCLRHLGEGRFRAFSCGIPGKVARSVSPVALEVLHRAGMPIARLRAKDWNSVLAPGQPKMDFVIALDAATIEAAPKWPAQPEYALWSYPPILNEAGSLKDREQAAELALFSLYRRIDLLVNLHPKISHRSELRQDVRELGHVW